MADVKVFDLDQLRARVIARVRVGGVDHDIKQPTGRMIQSLRAAADADRFVKLCEIVRACVPTLTDDDMADLLPHEIDAIATLASGSIAAVEAEFPNAFGPELNTSTSPG